jgi:hypothetical protein
MRGHHWEEVRRRLARSARLAAEARRALERDLDERSGGPLSRLMTPRQATRRRAAEYEGHSGSCPCR